MKRSMKKTISLFVVGFILGISIMTVFAATYTSGPYGYYGPYLGYEYKNQSTVTTDGQWGCFADTIVRTTDTAYAPIGYMGALARLYNSNGDLKTSSEWYYNEEEIHLCSQVTPHIYTKGTYYSKGASRAYTGTTSSGYVTYDAFQSPYLKHEP